MILVVLAACGPVGPVLDAGTDAAATDAGSGDAGADAGVGDAGVPVVKTDHSLFWSDAGYLDDAALISFAKVMATVAPDGHGGALLDQWFRRFASTTHSSRALPEQFVDDVAAMQGPDAGGWNLSLLPFKVTGVHNRIDLAALGVGGHCGELRVSLASESPTLRPFHLLFLFRQPAEADDVGAGGVVHCRGTAQRWAALSALDGDALVAAVKAAWAKGFTRDRFLLAESVEKSLGPWEWRQWTPLSGGTAFDNPPLFQQVDVERLNVAGTARDGFLAWVAANAAGLNARTVEVPASYRSPSARMADGVPRVPLTLVLALAPDGGVVPDAGVVAPQFPQLRQQLELVGCVVCHTADADFVQTRENRTISKFYEKELLARERHLEKMARGESPKAPFGPLQAMPVLPP